MAIITGQHVTLTPTNTATAALGLYTSGISPTGFNVGTNVTPNHNQGASTYGFCYVVMG